MRRPDRGQATTETILLTWLLILFIAAVYQIFLVHDNMFRAMSRAEERMFSRAFERNCYDDRADCDYTMDQDRSGGLGARIVWNEENLPEVNVPVVSLFRRFGLEEGIHIQSNAQDRIGADEGSSSCPYPCKRTKMASGTYVGPFDALVDFEGFDPGEAIKAITDMQNLFDWLSDFFDL
jgi:hypothetical protein